MIFTRHTDLRNKTPLFAEVARRTACPRAAEGARVRARAQNMLNDLKRIGNSYQVPQGQRLRVVSSESQSDNTIMPLCPPPSDNMADKNRNERGGRMPAVGSTADCAVSVFSGKQHYTNLRHSVIDSAGL